MALQVWTDAAQPTCRKHKTNSLITLDQSQSKKNLIELIGKSSQPKDFLTIKREKTRILEKNSRSLVVLAHLERETPFVIKRIMRQNHRQKQIIQELSHSKILKCLGSFEDSDYIYIITEFCSGGDLKNKIDKQGTLKEKKVKNYLKQLLQALNYLHQSGKVHRDLKASNVLIRGKNVVLADFQCLDQQSQTNIQFKGSVLWMAPEIARQQIITTKSDIWSFGCIAIEMLTGKLPWDQCGFDNQISAICHIGANRNHPMIPQNTSKQLRQILQRCFSIDWQNRPSCAQLLRHKYFN